MGPGARDEPAGLWTSPCGHRGGGLLIKGLLWAVLEPGRTSQCPGVREVLEFVVCDGVWHLVYKVRHVSV